MTPATVAKLGSPARSGRAVADHCREQRERDRDQRQRGEHRDRADHDRRLGRDHANPARLPREHGGHAARGELGADERRAERPPDDGQHARDALEEALQSGPMEARVVRVGHLRRSGSTRWRSVSEIWPSVRIGHAVRLETGAVSCVLGVLLRLGDPHPLLVLRLRQRAGRREREDPAHARSRSATSNTVTRTSRRAAIRRISARTRRVTVRPNRSARRTRLRGSSRPAGSRSGSGRRQPARASRLRPARAQRRRGCARRRLRLRARRP